MATFTNGKTTIEGSDEVVKEISKTHLTQKHWRIILYMILGFALSVIHVVFNPFGF